MAPQHDRGVPRAGERWAPRKVQKALRITERDELLLETVRAVVPEASSESDLAYILWKRGLILTLAKALGGGAPPPPAMGEDLLATLIAQELLNAMPLLQRTGRLDRLNLVLAASGQLASPTPLPPVSADEVDSVSVEELTTLGGADFI